MFRHLLSLMLILIAAQTSWTQTRIGQNNVSGIIRSDEDASSLPAVSVYAQGTTKGTTSQANGTFSINDMPTGEFDIVFSLLGYERQIKHISLRGNTSLTVNVQLKRKEIKVAAVEVTGSADEWKRLLPNFTTQFLGISENAQRCKILNPEVVNLSGGTNGESLTAQTDSTLVVENQALGYRIHVEIERFFYDANQGWFTMVYYPRFVDMKAANEQQRENWLRQRDRCYRYSFTHFLRSVLQRRISQSNFLVSSGELWDLQRAEGMRVADSIIAVSTTRDSTRFWIDFHSEYIRVDREDEFGSWRVSMLGAGISPHRQSLPLANKEITSSIVRFNQRPIQVDSNGNLIDPLSVGFHAYWATCRLADTLPFDYQPEKE